MRGANRKQDKGFCGNRVLYILHTPIYTEKFTYPFIVKFELPLLVLSSILNFI